MLQHYSQLSQQLKNATNTWFEINVSAKAAENW